MNEGEKVYNKRGRPHNNINDTRSIMFQDFELDFLTKRRYIHGRLSEEA